MFNYNAFTPNQNSPTLHPAQAKPLKNVSPAYFPGIQNAWPSPSNFAAFGQPPQEGEEKPFNIKAVPDNEDPVSSTSSDSEETDTMPDVDTLMTNALLKDWDFGQGEAGRRKSEVLQTINPILQRPPIDVGQSNPKSWVPFPTGKVNVKPAQFGPLNTTGFVQVDKRAYFVILEGFNVNNGKRFFKIEKLCHSLQPRTAMEGNNSQQFLYLGLWNDLRNGQSDSDNVFEPWIYAIQHMQFRLVVTVHMTFAYEDPYTFDYLVDLRQFGFPTNEIKTHSLEVIYAEPKNTRGDSGNNVTLHLQLTNDKVNVSNGFSQRTDKQEAFSGYTVILRQILIGLPLSRTESPVPIFSPLQSIQALHRPSDVYAKRGSAINLGQEHRSPMKDVSPSSPMSWSNFSPEISPVRNHGLKTQKIQSDPEKPPGIPTPNVGEPTNQNQYMTGGSLFKFRNQQRFSIQPVKREAEEFTDKKINRIQSSDLSVVLEGDKSPLKVLEAYVNAVKSGNRRGNHMSQRSSLLGRLADNDPASHSVTTLNPSSHGESINEIGQFEGEENAGQHEEITEEFRVEDYIGRIADFAKTYQGSKVLQKYIIACDKEDLNAVVQELADKIGELMLDPYANYTVQTLMQNSLPRHRLHILQKLTPYFDSIARDKKGTHSLQAIMAHVNTPDEFGMVKNILNGAVFDLSMDPRANYVIQKLINTIPTESSQFLYQPLFDNFVQIANNSFGLLVLKQMMARVEQKEALKQKVMELTSLHFEKLIQNPYGNYAIQHIIEFYPKEAHIIMSKILTKIIPYSSQKISSNVIEKCLAVCDSHFRRRVVEEILRNGRLGDLLKNKYGNFVTLQLLATASNVDKQRLMQEIFRCANSFNGTKYKMRWLKFTEENPLKINWNANTIIKQEEGALEDVNGVYTNGTYAEKLEAVKKIWRDMTKEEKSETAPYQYSNSPQKKNYNKRDDNGRGWSDKNQ